MRTLLVELVPIPPLPSIPSLHIPPIDSSSPSLPEFESTFDDAAELKCVEQLLRVYKPPPSFTRPLPPLPLKKSSSESKLPQLWFEFLMLLLLGGRVCLCSLGLIACLMQTEACQLISLADVYALCDHTAISFRPCIHTS